MLALLIAPMKSAAASIVAIWHFADDVIEDMRRTRAELEAKYGPLGF